MDYWYSSSWSRTTKVSHPGNSRAANSETPKLGKSQVGQVVGSREIKDRDRDELRGTPQFLPETPVNDTSEEAPTAPGGTSKSRWGDESRLCTLGEQIRLARSRQQMRRIAKATIVLWIGIVILGEAGDTLANQSTDEDNANMAPHQNASVKGRHATNG